MQKMKIRRNHWISIFGTFPASTSTISSYTSDEGITVRETSPVKKS